MHCQALPHCNMHLHPTPPMARLPRQRTSAQHTTLCYHSRRLENPSTNHMGLNHHSCKQTNSLAASTGRSMSPQRRVRLMQPLQTTGSSTVDAATSDAAAVAPDVLSPKLAAPVVIIGGGPAGLASAVMLARRGYSNIKVYERLPEPPAPDDLSVWGNFEQASERLYMIGLNGRGQAVLRDLELMDRIDSASSLVLGRLDWKPETPPDSPTLTYYGTTRTYKTRCLQRDRLASCILQELREKYGHVVSVEFGVTCANVSWSRSNGGQEVCRLALQRRLGGDGASPESWTEESPFVIGADGAGSALRAGMEQNSNSSLKLKRYPDKNTIVYRTIPLFWPKEMTATRPGDVNYSARTKSGVNFDCLPTREGPFIGVLLYKPGDKQIAALKTTEDVRQFFQRNFPAFIPAIREVDLERFASKSDQSLPTFSYVGPALHHGSSTCLVGDTIHTVKPYFGQGVNSAFEDVKVLQQALDQTGDDVGSAVRRYSELRSKDAEALVVLSHSLDGGFLTFVGPLILDSILHKMLPKVFSPNIIASLQNEKWSFSQVRNRKRLDRAMQLGLVAGFILTLKKVVSMCAGFVAKMLSKAGMS